MIGLRVAIVAAIALAALLVPAVGFASEVARPGPPPLPFAVADAEATFAVVAQSDGTVAAVELSSGQVRWRSAQGRWPLASAHGWVAVGLPDGADPRALRVRFLRPTDGKLIVTSAPILLPAAGHLARWLLGLQVPLLGAQGRGLGALAAGAEPPPLLAAPAPHQRSAVEFLRKLPPYAAPAECPVACLKPCRVQADGGGGRRSWMSP